MTSAVVAFPIYILVVATLLFALVAGRLGPRLRASSADIGTV